jgi:mannose-6-phosphate isomerase-like protein (cupin superfamily)
VLSWGGSKTVDSYADSYSMLQSNKIIIVLDSDILMENPSELKDLLSELEEKAAGYFVDFITTKGIQAGIIRLHPGEIDAQEPHSADEVYYVIEGTGFIKLDYKNHPIKQGTFIFVPTGSEHRFHGNTRDLVLF